jgi:Arc/MetJ-type ribon-helix-helix transcriptional regulator
LRRRINHPELVINITLFSGITATTVSSATKTDPATGYRPSDPEQGQKGEYTSAIEVMRDAVRRMQEADASRKERLLLSDFEPGLTQAEREGIGDGVRRGIVDIEARRFEEYDAKGLRDVAKELIAARSRTVQPPKGSTRLNPHRDTAC